MGSLVLWKIRSVGGAVFGSWVVPSGTSHFVTDETFVVLDMFGTLGGSEIDSIHVHCHGVSGGFLGSRGSGNVVGFSA